MLFIFLSKSRVIHCQIVKYNTINVFYLMTSDTIKMFLSLECSTMQLFPIYAMEFCFPYSSDRVKQAMDAVLNVTKLKQCKCSIIIMVYVI